MSAEHPGLLGRLEHAAAAEISGLAHPRARRPPAWVHAPLATAAAALRRLPPFALGTLLTATVGLPVSVFALPAAGARLGALPTAAIVLAAGVAIALGMGALGEAVTRSVGVRRDGGYLGRLFGDLLGRRAGTVITPVTAVRTSLSLLGTWIGLSLTLAALFGLPREVWAAAAGLLILLTLARGSAGGFTTIALLGLVSAVLLVVVAGVAFAAGGEGDLLRGAGSGSALTALGAVIGVALMQFIGQVYVIGVARSVFPGDESGAAVIRGSIAGTLVIAGLAALWVLAVGSAVPPEVLAGEQGTGLGPLADRAGTLVTVLGGALSVLLLGVGTQRQSMAVYAFAHERVGNPVLAGVPVVLLFLGAEGLLALDVSFSEVVNVAGVLTQFFVAGAVPLMLGLAARRHGELPVRGAVGWLAHPAVVAAGSALCVGALLFFGTAVYTAPVPRLAALGTGVALGLGCLTLLRSRAFYPAVVVGLDGGRLVTRHFTGTVDGLALGGEDSRAVEVWARPTAVIARLRRGGGPVREVDLGLGGGRAALPAAAGPFSVTLTPRREPGPRATPGGAP